MASLYHLFSELAQLKLNIETSVRDSTPTEAGKWNKSSNSGGVESPPESPMFSKAERVHCEMIKTPIDIDATSWCTFIMSGGVGVEYTVQRLGRLAGVSTRTLRYYDGIGILKPARINSSGYRIYGKAEVDRLQQILFYRELGMSLENICSIITSPSFDSARALKEHRLNLLAKREQLDMLISNIDKTIASVEGSIEMTDKEKFEGFKQKMLDENERKYGKEIREKYGVDQVEKSNKRFMNMTDEQYAKAEKLGNDVKVTLSEAFKTGDPAGELAQKAADLHRQWLYYFWESYSSEAHAGVAQMYVDDERFTAYYDKELPGMAAFLRDAILIYTGMNK